MDPFAQIVDRNPGNICTQNYECRSKYCSMQEGLCKVPSSDDISC